MPKTETTFFCKNCHDQGWVCENHGDVPWNDGDQKCCGGAGSPCRYCNPCDENNPPRMMPGFEEKEL